MEVARQRHRDGRRRRRALPKRVASVRAVHDRVGGRGRQATVERDRAVGGENDVVPQQTQEQQQAAGRVRLGTGRPGHRRQRFVHAQAVPMVDQIVRVRQAHVHVRHHTVLQVRAQHVLPNPVAGRHGGGRQRDAPDRQRRQVRTVVIDRGDGGGGGRARFPGGRRRRRGRRQEQGTLVVQTGNQRCRRPVRRRQRTRHGGRPIGRGRRAVR